MSQSNPGNINPSTTSGAVLAAILSAYFTGTLPTLQSGATRPSWAQEGLIYLNTAGSPAYLVLCGSASDGSQDIPLIALTTIANGQVLQANADGVLVPVSVSTLTSALSAMTGATSLANGTKGLVPQPTTGQQDYVLSGGGVFVLRELLGQLYGLNTQTSSVTLALTDLGKMVEVNSASNTTITIPPNSSVAFPIGAWIPLCRMGTGDVTIAGGSGVTLRQRESKFKIGGQYAECVVRQRATDEWILSGDLKA